MFPKSEQPEQCLSTELLLRHVFKPEGLTDELLEQVVDHIGRCARCGGIYAALSDTAEEMLEGNDLAFGLSESELHSPRAAGEVRAGTRHKADALETVHCRKYRWAFMFRLGRIAVAACVVMAVGIDWFVMHKNNFDQPKPNMAANTFRLYFGDPVVHVVVGASSGRVVIVRITPEGHYAISPYLPFIAGGARTHRLQDVWDHGLRMGWKIPRIQQEVSTVQTVSDLRSIGHRLGHGFIDVFAAAGADADARHRGGQK
jgi:hypothetical protein